MKTQLTLRLGIALVGIPFALLMTALGIWH